MDSQCVHAGLPRGARRHWTRSTRLVSRPVPVARPSRLDQRSKRMQPNVVTGKPQHAAGTTQGAIAESDDFGPRDPVALSQCPRPGAGAIPVTRRSNCQALAPHEHRMRVLPHCSPVSQRAAASRRTRITHLYSTLCSAGSTGQKARRSRLGPTAFCPGRRLLPSRATMAP